MTYHNTTFEEFAEVNLFEGVCDRQESLILQYARNLPYPQTQFSCETLRPLFPASVPITSIRRAVCNLKNEGLVCVVGKVPGEYGRNIFLYEVV